MLRSWATASFLRSQHLKSFCVPLGWRLSTKVSGFTEVRWVDRGSACRTISLLSGKRRIKTCWYPMRSFSQRTCEVGITLLPFWREDKWVPERFSNCQSHKTHGWVTNSSFRVWEGTSRTLCLHVCLSPVAWESILGQGSCLSCLLHTSYTKWRSRRMGWIKD